MGDLVLYHSPNARSFRALWMLEELRLPYRLELVAFPPRARQKDYLDLNPLGTVPLLIDGETRMTESSAICEYLAARYGDGGLSIAASDPDYGRYLNALYYGEATLTFPQTLVLRYGALEPEERRSAQVVDDYTKWFLSRLKTVEATMQAHDFMAGNRFTAADVSVGYALMLASILKLDAGFGPSTAAYWQRLKDREGFARAKVAQKTAAGPSEKVS